MGPRWTSCSPRAEAADAGGLAAGQGQHALEQVGDPAPDYPPGAGAATTLHGTVHDLAGLLVFASVTAAALVLPRRLPGAPVWARWSHRAGVAIAALWVTCSVLAALDHSGILPGAPSGLVERLALAAICAWMVATARRVLR